MLSNRYLTPFVLGLLLAGCSFDPPPEPLVLVYPGAAKTAVAFQQDDAACRQHAVTHAGYDGNGSGILPEPPDIPDYTAYAQCMASRGDIVRLQQQPYPAEPYLYPYGDPDVFLSGGFGLYRHGWHRGFAHHGPGHAGIAHAGGAGRR